MDDTTHAPSDEGPPATQRSRRLRWLALVTLLVAIALGYVLFGDRLSLAELARREALFREYHAQHPVLVWAAAFGVYVLVTGLSLPGATAMTLVCGWLFGFWRGLLLVSFASTAGASLAFLSSRFLLRDAIRRRFGDRLAAVNAALDRDGAWYLFTLRLIPAVPFFVINVVMGLMSIRLPVFWIVSQLGMLPATAVYVYAGSSVPNLQTLADRGARGVLRPELLAALVLLGVFPLVVKILFRRFARPGDAEGLPPRHGDTEG